MRMTRTMRAGVFLAALALASLALAACAPGVQPLLDEYNALFGSVTERGQEAAGDGGDWFSKESYSVSAYNNLDLHAPAHCSSYQWTLEPDPKFPNVELPPGFNIEDYLTNGGAYLNVYLPKAGFQAGTRYILTCTVVSHGETLTDWCYIVVTK